MGDSYHFYLKDLTRWKAFLSTIPSRRDHQRINTATIINHIRGRYRYYDGELGNGDNDLWEECDEYGHKDDHWKFSFSDWCNFR